MKNPRRSSLTTMRSFASDSAEHLSFAVGKPTLRREEWKALRWLAKLHPIWPSSI
jgi:hypothetical protein